MGTRKRAEMIAAAAGTRPPWPPTPAVAARGTIGALAHFAGHAMPAPTPLIAGNWKMHRTASDTRSLIEDIVKKGDVITFFSSKKIALYFLKYNVDHKNKYFFYRHYMRF